MTSSEKLRVGVLTVSDRSSQGLRKDASGPELENLLKSRGFDVLMRAVVPDEKVEISRMLVQWADSQKIDIILTTGGTGVSPRDVTPEATVDIVDKLVPGMAEAMRLASLQKRLMR